MIKRIFTITGLGLAAIVALTLAVDSEAGLMDKFRKASSGDSGEPKMVSSAAEFTGSLTGEIRVGGKKFLVNGATKVYVIGEGMKRQSGMFVQGRPMMVRGWQLDGVAVADLIVLRPDPSRIEVPSTPKVPREPSATNPDVGMLAEDHAH